MWTLEPTTFTIDSAIRSLLRGDEQLSQFTLLLIVISEAQFSSGTTFYTQPTPVCCAGSLQYDTGGLCHLLPPDSAYRHYRDCLTRRVTTSAVAAGRDILVLMRLWCDLASSDVEVLHLTPG